MGGRFDPHLDSHPVRRNHPSRSDRRVSTLRGLQEWRSDVENGEKAPEGVRTGVRKIAG